MKNLVYIPVLIFFIAATFKVILTNQTHDVPTLDMFLITFQYGIMTLIILYFSTQIAKTSNKKKFIFLILWFLYLFVRIFGFSQVTSEYEYYVLGVIMLLGWGFIYIAPWVVLVDKYEQKNMSYTLIISLIGLVVMVGVIYIQVGEVFLTTFINYLLAFPLWYFIIYHITKSLKKELPIFIVIAIIGLIIGRITNLGIGFSDPYTYLAVIVLILAIRNHKVILNSKT